MTCSHYLTDTKCENCDHYSFFYFINPNPLLRGWFGGCGSIECTGLKNILIHDKDGSFLGHIG